MKLTYVALDRGASTLDDVDSIEHNDGCELTIHRAGEPVLVVGGVIAVITGSVYEDDEDEKSPTQP